MEEYIEIFLSQLFPVCNYPRLALIFFPRLAACFLSLSHAKIMYSYIHHCKWYLKFDSKVVNNIVVRLGVEGV